VGVALFASALVLTPPAPHAQASHAVGIVTGADVTTAIQALERHAAARFTYKVDNSGYYGNGEGWFGFEGGAAYSNSIARQLKRGGFLAGELPGQPDSPDEQRDLLVYRCKDRVGVFGESRGERTSAVDRGWWSANGCTTYPINRGWRSLYFKVSKPLSTFETNDDRRVRAVAQAVAAFEAYGSEHGTYWIDGAGGGGQGWYQYRNGTSYPASLVSRLISEGHLTNAYLTDPKDTNKSTHSNYDFLVYRCKNRIAVFAKSDGIKPSASDAQWWTNNGCTTYPSVSLKHPYFQLSSPSNGDALRSVALTQAIKALESYGDAHLTYAVSGGGGGGAGQGWYQYSDGASYPNSIVNVLTSEGHLANTYLTDPSDANKSTHSSFDFLVYRCKDRVAVFAKSDGRGPSAADARWWKANGCTTYPSITLNHPFFKLSKPVSTTPSNDSQRLLGIGQAITALESYGAENFTYAVLGGGYLGQGRGWFERDPAISVVLQSQGHLQGDVIGDPNGTLMVYQCKDRVAVFAKTDYFKTNAEDLQWWNANGCARNPIDRYEHEFFRLSRPLAPATCFGKPVTVNMNLGQTPTLARDVIMGTPGPDTITVYNGETVCAGAGDDVITGNQNNVRIDAGSGNDIVTANSSGDFVVLLGDGDDQLTSAANANVVEAHGGNGNDRLVGGVSPDKLFGDAGHDEIHGLGGNDQIRGGDGDDTVRGGVGNDTIAGDPGTDRLHGDDGNDIISGGGGNDHLYGLNGNDTLTGNAGNDIISGGPGADTLNGSTGNDRLLGQSGSDRISGGNGNDILVGGSGPDALIDGGAGSDTCHDAGAINCEARADTQAPTDFDFRVQASGTQNFVVKWDASTDNVQVAEYKLFIDGQIRPIPQMPGQRRSVGESRVPRTNSPCTQLMSKAMKARIKPSPTLPDPGESSARPTQWVPTSISVSVATLAIVPRGLTGKSLRRLPVTTSSTSAGVAWLVRRRQVATRSRSLRVQATR